MFQSLHDIIAVIFNPWSCELHLATYAWKITNTSCVADNAAEIAINMYIFKQRPNTLSL